MMTTVNRDRNCRLCPRLAEHLDGIREKYPDWHNAPVNGYGPIDAPILIAGLAPGLKGANRTGRPFTGDYAGDLLFKMLNEFGLSKGQYKACPDDGLTLTKARIVNAVRCLPPQNKPIGSEIATCRPFLAADIAAMDNLKVILTLGRIAHDSVLRSLGHKISDAPFRHAGQYLVKDRYQLVSSYHCSRYNTQTKRLTEPMFRDAFQKLMAAAKL